MNNLININGRHVEITSPLRDYVAGRLAALASDTVIKTVQINVMLSNEKNRFSASLVLNCKYHVLNADAEDFELGKAFETAADKLEAQVRTLRDRIRSHKAEGLAGNELRQTERVQGE